MMTGNKNYRSAQVIMSIIFASKTAWMDGSDENLLACQV